MDRSRRSANTLRSLLSQLIIHTSTHHDFEGIGGSGKETSKKGTGVITSEMLDDFRRDTTFDALDRDGGAWVVVSAHDNPLVLRCTDSWLTLSGLSQDAVVGQPLATLMVGPQTETAVMGSFIDNLISIAGLTAPDKPATAKDDTDLHCLLTLYKKATPRLSTLTRDRDSARSMSL